MSKKEKKDKKLTVSAILDTKAVPEVHNASWLPLDSKPLLEKNEASKIWDEIKDVQLNLFSLPDQTISKYCKPIAVEPTKLYITVSASSVLTALDESLGKKFEIVSAGKFIIISRK